MEAEKEHTIGIGEANALGQAVNIDVASKVERQELDIEAKVVGAVDNAVDLLESRHCVGAVEVIGGFAAGRDIVNDQRDGFAAFGAGAPGMDIGLKTKLLSQVNDALASRRRNQVAARWIKSAGNSRLSNIRQAS